MEIAELVHDYMETLVWPAVVLGCILAFRSQLRQLFSRMRRIETLGGAAEFEAMVREAAEIAEDVQESSPRAVTPGEVRRRTEPAAHAPPDPSPEPAGDGTSVLHRLVPERISAEDLAGDRRIDRSSTTHSGWWRTCPPPPSSRRTPAWSRSSTCSCAT
jgi:hypothetical protein